MDICTLLSSFGKWLAPICTKTFTDAVAECQQDKYTKKLITGSESVSRHRFSLLLDLNLQVPIFRGIEPRPLHQQSSFTPKHLEKYPQTIPLIREIKTILLLGSPGEYSE